MYKFEDFALRMSVLLFDMRIDDVIRCGLTSDDNREIPELYINKVLNDEDHCTNIKEKIRLSVLQHVTSSPDDFKFKEGKYWYTTPYTYDNAYCMDNYIEEQFMIDNPIMGCRYVCNHCGSDNVQIKAWVRPNKNNEYVKDDNETGFCDDCNLHAIIDTCKMNVRTKVIGYQVKLSTQDVMHPDMSASFCVYSLPQAKKMISQDPNDWQLLTIYDDTIEDPTMMFNGDCRNPDEPILDVLLKK